MIKNDRLIPNMSSSTTNKEKREGWKGRILDFVVKNAEKGHSTSGSDLINFCTKKIGIGETVSRELIHELVRENVLYSVVIRNNEKHYFPKDRPILNEFALLQRNLVVALGLLDQQLNWMEKSYNTLKIEEKGASVRHTIEIIFRHVNRLVVLQALSNPESDSYRKALTDYRKRIQRFYQIINSENNPDSKTIITWFYYLLETFPHDFKEFVEPL